MRAAILKRKNAPDWEAVKRHCDVLDPDPDLGISVPKRKRSYATAQEDVRGQSR